MSRHRRSVLSQVSRGNGRIAGIEALESRQMLSANPIEAALIDVHGPDMQGKDGPLASVGLGLSLLYHEHEDYMSRRAGEPFKPSSELIELHEDRVVVDIVVDMPEDPTEWKEVSALQQTLVDVGLEITGTWGAMVSGLLPIPAIPQLAGLDGIRAAMASAVTTNVGLVDTQGDVAQRSDDARAGFGVDGSGITVGVLSDSFDTSTAFDIHAADDVRSGDLPGLGNPLGYHTPVKVLRDSVGGNIDEGRAMLQLVHDVAPGAELAFHTAQGGQAAFANGIVNLATAAGADVIVDDIIYFAEPMFQDGIVAQAVDLVVDMGVPYFSSAGNASRTSYESGFDGSGTEGFFGGELHDFNPGSGVDEFQAVTIDPGATVALSFQWDDPFASVTGGLGADSDLDIFLLDAPSTDASILALSANSNVGADPVEVLGFTNPTAAPVTAYLAIENAEGPDPGLMKYIGFIRGGFTVDDYATNSSTAWGHTNAAGAESVGAAAFFETPEFGLSPPLVQPFSSLGGVPILFDTAGNRLATPDVRMKPEITGPDGGNTTFFIRDSDQDTDLYPNFFGTSASAPHAAAIAALMLDQGGGPGSRTPDQIYGALESTAIDMDDPFTPGFDVGFDHQTGYGLIDGHAAVQATPPGAPTLSEPIPVPLSPIDPMGSLIYHSSVNSDVREVGDIDRFTVDVDRGQTISLAIESVDRLQTSVELFDPQGGSIGSATASGPGASAVVQTAPANSAGTYMAVVSGVNSGSPGTADFTDSGNWQSSVFSPNSASFSSNGATTPGGDAQFSVFAVANLEQPSEFLTVDFEGIFSANLFVNNGQDLVPISETITIPEVTVAALAADGTINFTLATSSGVANIGPTQAAWQLAYPGTPADGTGRYTLGVVLNATIEEESFGLGSNEPAIAAQKIDASFIPLGSERGAAVGTLTGPNSFDPPIPIPVAEVEPNNSRAGAQNIDGELWTLAPDTIIKDATTIPHVSIKGTGDDTFDYYSFTVSSGNSKAIFDIDETTFGFDTELFLYDGAGNLLASNDDTVPPDPGSSNIFDSKIESTLGPGAYVIAVGQFDSSDDGGMLTGSAPDPGVSYTLHVSIENHTFNPGTPKTQDSRDWYRFDALQGDVITIATTAVTGSASSLSMQLRNSPGTLLASGSSGAANVDLYIQDFEIPADGVYFVQLDSNDDVDYSLVVTRGATFELVLPGGQGIDVTDTVLGNVDGEPGSVEVIDFTELPQQPVDGVSLKGATFGFTIGGVSSIEADFGSFANGTALTTDPILLGNAAGVLEIDFDAPTPSLGFTVALVTLGFVVDPGVTVTLFDRNSAVIDTIDVAVVNQGFTPFSEALFGYSGTPVSKAVLDFNELAGPFFVLDDVKFISGGFVETDSFGISVDSGDVVQLSTSRPSDGPYEFVNDLLPQLQVLDPNGNLVSKGGGSLRFTAGRTGTYTIQMTAAAGNFGGEYVLRANRELTEGVDLTGGVLRIVGANKQDIIFVENGTSPVGTVEVRASFLDNIRTFSAAAIQRIEIYGRNGWDRIYVSHPIDVPTMIQGGKGSDILETGRGPSTIIGGHGNDVLKGSKQNDVLDGGAGNDVLKGRGGDDILIGGGGQDRLDGGGGEDILIGGSGRDLLGGSWGSDILIGGKTSYDESYGSLQLILAEWTSNRGYNRRVDNIRNGTGPILGGTGLHLTKGDTVKDDGVAEIEIRGMQARDWFFAKLNEISDKQDNEARN